MIQMHLYDIYITHPNSHSTHKFRRCMWTHYLSHNSMILQYLKARSLGLANSVGKSRRYLREGLISLKIVDPK
jgi:hypothetical protein